MTGEDSLNPLKGPTVKRAAFNHSRTKSGPGIGVSDSNRNLATMVNSAGYIDIESGNISHNQAKAIR